MELWNSSSEESVQKAKQIIAEAKLAIDTRAKEDMEAIKTYLISTRSEVRGGERSEEKRIGLVEILSSPKKVGRSKIYYVRDISRRTLRRKTAVAAEKTAKVVATAKEAAK